MIQDNNFEAHATHFTITLQEYGTVVIHVLDTLLTA